jgi:hypothetical protein
MKILIRDFQQDASFLAGQLISQSIEFGYEREGDHVFEIDDSYSEEVDECLAIAVEEYALDGKGTFEYERVS